MRRTDRAVRENDEIMEIVMGESVCTVAFQDSPFPYLIPLNFGAAVENGKLTLYFHGAGEGTKLALLKENPNVSFSVMGSYTVVLDGQNPGKSFTRYESVCGRGRAELVPEEDKAHGLAVLMNHLGRLEKEPLCFAEEDFAGPSCGAAVVFKLTVESIIGKRHL